MSKLFIEEKEFKAQNFSKERLPRGEYEACTFVQCQFANADSSFITFIDCTFHECDFSSSNINNTSFRDCTFQACKLLGLRFDTCNTFLFSANYEDCNLSLASFYRLGMKATTFVRCLLSETDFTETDLTSATFSDCNLSGAIFERTILEKADFRTAQGFSIDPEKNKLKKAKFSANTLAGLLEKYNLQISQ